MFFSCQILIKVVVFFRLKLPTSKIHFFFGFSSYSWRFLLFLHCLGFICFLVLCELYETRHKKGDLCEIGASVPISFFAYVIGDEAYFVIYQVSKNSVRCGFYRLKLKFCKIQVSMFFSSYSWCSPLFFTF